MQTIIRLFGQKRILYQGECEVFGPQPWIRWDDQEYRVAYREIQDRGEGQEPVQVLDVYLDSWPRTKTRKSFD